jgi:hypothetical protein
MGIMISNKRVNYSHGPAQIKQQVGYCIVEAFLVHGQARANMNSQHSPWPGLEGCHHLPPYSILYA